MRLQSSVTMGTSPHIITAGNTQAEFRQLINEERKERVKGLEIKYQDVSPIVAEMSTFTV